MAGDGERTSATAEPRDAPDEVVDGGVAHGPPRERAAAAASPRPDVPAASAVPVGERRGTGALSVARSVGAAMIGVQSRKNRERDFTEGKPIHFIIGGVIGTLLFLLAVWLLVQYLIATS